MMICWDDLHDNVIPGRCHHFPLHHFYCQWCFGLRSVWLLEPSPLAEAENNVTQIFQPKSVNYMNPFTKKRILRAPPCDWHSEDIITVEGAKLRVDATKLKKVKYFEPTKHTHLHKILSENILSYINVHYFRYYCSLVGTTYFYSKFKGVFKFAM